MSIKYIENGNVRNIGTITYGSNVIKQVYYGNQLVYSKFNFPTSKSVPSSYTATDYLTVSGRHCAVGTISEDGFYKVIVCGSRGHNGEYYTWGTTGGKTEQIIYLYKGTNIFMWASEGGSRAWDYSWNTGGGATAFPNSLFGLDQYATNLGGHGDWGTGEGGGGGGSPISPGRGATHVDGGGGGGGAGFIAGLPYTTGCSNTFTNSNWSKSVALNTPLINIQLTAWTAPIIGGNYDWIYTSKSTPSVNDAVYSGKTTFYTASTNKVYAVNNNKITIANSSTGEVGREFTRYGTYDIKEAYCYILAGGGGGGVGRNNYRVGGGGGGAFGNGGPAANGSQQSASGGNWGKGNNGVQYGGGDGAWCIMDFSRNQLNWGTGGGSDAAGNGYVKLQRLT